jgi:TonB family protein
MYIVKVDFRIAKARRRILLDVGSEEFQFPSRIRCPRGADSQAFNTEQHRTGYLVSYTEPVYPAEARAGGIEGTVVLDVVVDREGAVQFATVREGHPLLAESALEAVRASRYRPTKLNGRLVEVATEVAVKFALPDTVVSF